MEKPKSFNDSTKSFNDLTKSFNDLTKSFNDSTKSFKDLTFYCAALNELLRPAVDCFPAVVTAPTLDNRTAGKNPKKQFIIVCLFPLKIKKG